MDGSSSKVMQLLGCNCPNLIVHEQMRRPSPKRGHFECAVWQKRWLQWLANIFGSSVHESFADCRAFQWPRLSNLSSQFRMRVVGLVSDMIYPVLSISYDFHLTPVIPCISQASVTTADRRLVDEQHLAYSPTGMLELGEQVLFYFVFAKKYAFITCRLF